MCIPVKLAEIRALTHGSSLALPLCAGAMRRESVSYSSRARTRVPVSPPVSTHVLYSIEESGYGLRPPVAR
jgi:hypothetical protein